jgi:hypothetical protein
MQDFFARLLRIGWYMCVMCGLAELLSPMALVHERRMGFLCQRALPCYLLMIGILHSKIGTTEDRKGIFADSCTFNWLRIGSEKAGKARSGL